MTALSRRTPWAILVACFFSLCTVSIAQSDKNCGSTSLNGNFGFEITGNNITMHIPYALVGRFSADGAGSFKGAGTESVNGDIARVAFSGTYTVDADCTGAAKLRFAHDGLANLAFIIVDNGNQLQIIVSDQGTLETGTAIKIDGHDKTEVTSPPSQSTGINPSK